MSEPISLEGERAKRSLDRIEAIAHKGAAMTDDEQDELTVHFVNVGLNALTSIAESLAIIAGRTRE